MEKFIVIAVVPLISFPFSIPVACAKVCFVATVDKVDPAAIFNTSVAPIKLRRCLHDLPSLHHETTASSWTVSSTA